jgi:AcrR family transcriptional regulator
MSRQVDDERPGELREAVLQYLLENGITDLSLRPLAKAIGSSPRGLLYHFGSKEKMLMAVVAELRDRQRTAFSQMSAETFAEACGAMWRHMSSPASEPQTRLFFELYGVALRYPRLYKEFLDSAVRDWLDFSVKQLRCESYRRNEALIVATVVIAGFRGFLMDLSATRDRARVTHAVNAWLRSLDSLLPLKRKKHP